MASRTVNFAITLVLLGVLSACVATFRNHGFAPTDAELEQLVVGVDTRGTVEEVIGTPSATGVMNESGWFYISTRIRHYAYEEPKVIERQVVVISFDDEDVLENVERFGLEDGRVITLSRRVTDLPVKGPGILRQLLGNIGNIDAGQILN